MQRTLHLVDLNSNCAVSSTSAITKWPAISRHFPSITVLSQRALCTRRPATLSGDHPSTLPMWRVLSWETSIATLQSLSPHCQQWVTFHLKISFEYNSTDWKIFMFQNTWTVMSEFPPSVTAEWPFQDHLDNGLEMAIQLWSVSQKTWTVIT